MSNEKASIVCFEQFIEAFLTESSKSPAEVAKKVRIIWRKMYGNYNNIMGEVGRIPPGFL